EEGEEEGRHNIDEDEERESVDRGDGRSSRESRRYTPFRFIKGLWIDILAEGSSGDSDQQELEKEDYEEEE
ncbi:hypothetical protein CSUI_005595, partial [Cystoisospora suis]